jgi:hypothetical protein
VAQSVEHLPSKCNALISKKKNKKGKGKKQIKQMPWRGNELFVFQKQKE